MPSHASVWISWPKKSAKVATDITEETIREVALPLGFVDIKVCARLPRYGPVLSSWCERRFAERSSESQDRANCAAAQLMALA
jgi:hypothetical protein